MCKLTKTKTYLLVLIMAFLTACLTEPVQEAEGITLIPSVTVSKPTATATVPAPTKTMVPTSTMMPTITPENTFTPTATLSATEIPVSSLAMRQECPTKVDTNSPLLLSSGSILFGTGFFVSNFADSYLPQEPGIWAISTNTLTPQLAYMIPESEASWVTVSGDGYQLQRDNSTRLDFSIEEMIFYDMRNQKEIRMEADSRVGWDYEWLPDGRIKYVVQEERIWEEGIKREYIILDPETQQSEIVIEELSLPGYNFNDEAIPHGYASVSPSGKLVLYTATTENDNVAVRLLNLETGIVVWQEFSPFLPGPLEPEWTDDSSYVLFYISSSEEDDNSKEIISLRSDGQIEELPTQPYPRLDTSSPRFLTRSSNQQYIIYRSGVHAMGSTGFVVDTISSKVGEICEDDTRFVDGQWLTDDLFVYRALIDKDGQMAHSLRILDIPNWRFQVLFESEPGYGVNLFGWTPVEFP